MKAAAGTHPRADRQGTRTATDEEEGTDAMSIIPTSPGGDTARQAARVSLRTLADIEARHDRLCHQVNESAVIDPAANAALAADLLNQIPMLTAEVRELRVLAGVRDDLEELQAEALRLAKKYPLQKILAIKDLRESTAGLTIRDAKDLMDAAYVLVARSQGGAL